MDKINVAFSSFPDGDTHCVIKDMGRVQSGKSALIVHRLYPEQNEQIIRLVLLVDLLKDLGVTDVSIFSPYLPYSRQDKRSLPGEALGAASLCRLLSNMGCRRLYTLDCHFMREKRDMVYEELPITSIDAASILLEVFRTRHTGNKPFHLVGPDKGASPLVRQADGQFMHKERGSYVHDGHVSKREVVGLTSDHLVLEHPTVVLIDDMMSTGTTMLQAIHNLSTEGITDIYCVATHGIFLDDSYEKLSRLTKAVIVSDSITGAPKPVRLTDRLLTDKIIPHFLEGILE
ncbi:MAG: ribose-phosphate diphosphokinase [Candidatus Saccharimonadales bacterium]